MQTMNLFYFLGLAIYLIDLIVLTYLIYEDRDPAETAFWALMIILFPVFGIILFFFFGRDWRRGTIRSRREHKLMFAAIKKSMPKIYKRYIIYHQRFLAKENNWLRNFVNINNSNDFSPVLPAETIMILPSGELSFKRLKKDMRESKSSIHLEFFIWEYDKLTAELTKIMLQKLKEGIEIRIKYDFLGCILYKKDELRTLKRAGAKVTSDITDINRFNYRNHRKIAVIDGTIGYTGGINVGQEYIDGGNKYPAWRDTLVRVTGPIVLDLQKVFAARWLLVGKENIFKTKYFPMISYTIKATPAQVNHSSPDYYWPNTRDTYLTAILNAKKKIYIQSPYFVPDQALFAALETAALSGIDVKILITGWPDKKTVWWAAHTFFERLLKAGVNIYLYTPGFMHAKTLLIDDCFTAIGSTNFDIRSFTQQKEDAIYFYDKKTAQMHLNIYIADLKKCRKYTLNDYNKLNKLQLLRNSVSKLLSNLY